MWVVEKSKEKSSEKSNRLAILARLRHIWDQMLRKKSSEKSSLLTKALSLNCLLRTMSFTECYAESADLKPRIMLRSQEFLASLSASSTGCKPRIYHCLLLFWSKVILVIPFCRKCITMFIVINNGIRTRFVLLSSVEK